MRIGIFTQCYHPTNNGVVVSIDTFRRELEEDGYEYFIFAPQTKDRQSKCDDARVFRYPSFSWPGQSDYPIALPYLAPFQIAEIHKLRLDLIHTQHLFTMGKLGLNIGRWLALPVVHTYHTLLAEYAHYIPLFGSLGKKYLIWRSRQYCNHCDQVVTPSAAMKKVLRSYGVTTPIETIPTGVELDDFANPFHKEVLKTRWDIPEDKKILLYVSRIAREKNLDFLFEAIVRLAQIRHDFHLLLVGGGPELEHYRHFVKKSGLEALVTFTGMQEKEQANRFFGAADIFVFPSVTETQGIVITEAMAAGIPAVAIDMMGPSDLIQDGVDGFLVPLNLADFSSKIEKLLDNEDLRKKMGERARKNAQNFSAASSAQKLEELYERTIAHHRS